MFLFSLIRFAAHFAIAFVILSIPFSNKSLFYHIQSGIAPYTSAFKLETRQLYERSSKAFALYTDSLVSRVDWWSGKKSDEVHHQKSSPKKNNSSWRGKNQEELDEEYEDRDRQSLERLLQEI